MDPARPRAACLKAFGKRREDRQPSVDALFAGVQSGLELETDRAKRHGAAFEPGHSYARRQEVNPPIPPEPDPAGNGVLKPSGGSMSVGFGTPASKALMVRDLPDSSHIEQARQNLAGAGEPGEHVVHVQRRHGGAAHRTQSDAPAVGVQPEVLVPDVTQRMEE
jgi:hypothetical protein